MNNGTDSLLCPPLINDNWQHAPGGRARVSGRGGVTSVLGQHDRSDNGPIDESGHHRYSSIDSPPESMVGLTSQHVSLVGHQGQRVL